MINLSDLLDHTRSQLESGNGQVAHPALTGLIAELGHLRNRAELGRLEGSAANDRLEPPGECLPASGSFHAPRL